MNKKRIRDYGITIGSLPTGKYNSIADISGVTVGHSTIDTETHKTGVTVILPRPENIFKEKLIASSYVLNGYGKTTGLVQINELGTLESPIALTNTLNIGLVQNALVSYTIKRCEEDGTPLFSYNPVVGECNDCHLNDIKDRAVKEEHVFAAFENASSDFEQGDVGAGKGTICYGLKGGIGSSSRKIKLGNCEYHIGVLVQSNFGKTEDLIINGMEVGKAIRDQITPSSTDKGSIISVIATDLPLSSRQLHRILKRAAIGLGRTGSHVGHGSGDIMIGFSTANTIPVCEKSSDSKNGGSGNGNSENGGLENVVSGSIVSEIKILNEDFMDLPFQAVIEAEEEAVLNSMIAADTVIGYTGDVRYGLGELLEKYLKENLEEY